MYQGGLPDAGSGATYDPTTGAYVTPTQSAQLALGKIVPFGAAALGVLMLTRGKSILGIAALGAAWFTWRQGV